jgi:hypothetical protein
MIELAGLESCGCNIAIDILLNIVYINFMFMHTDISANFY